MARAVSGTTCWPMRYPAACTGSKGSCASRVCGQGGGDAGFPRHHGDRTVIVGNVLDRPFRADRPIQKWVADFTYIWTAEGWLCCRGDRPVLAPGSRMVDERQHDSPAVTDEPIMAIWRRGKPDALLHHSDQGSQGGFNPVVATPSR
jgi:hypothetical protein